MELTLQGWAVADDYFINGVDLQDWAVADDSIKNAVDPARLGSGCGLHVIEKKAATISDCLQTVEKAVPLDAIRQHTNVNDLKTADAEDASQRLVACVKTILATNQTTQVIVS